MKLKELYQISKKKLEEIIENKNPDFRLEEAEFDNEKKIWNIVVSYLENIKSENLPSFAVSYPFERIFKKLKIKEDKEFLVFYIYDKQ